MRAHTIGAGLALCLLGVTAPQAHAAEYVSTFSGGCSFATLEVPEGGGHWTGDWYLHVTLSSPTYGNAVAADVTCVLQVNGVTQPPRMGASGTGVVVAAGPLEYDAHVSDVVVLCTRVDYTSDDTPTELQCGVPLSTQIVPQEVVFALDLVFWALDPAITEFNAVIDTVVCPTFGQLAPGTGPVTITPRGDVYLDGELFWDCTPYQDPPPPREPTYARQGYTGGGWDDGDTGLLTLITPKTTNVTYPVVAPDGHDVSATCAFHRNDDGGIEVLGHTTTTDADASTVHCRLLDANRSVVYDRTLTAAGPVATLRDTVPAVTGKVSVCTEGTGTWGSATATTGFHCRYAT